MSGFALSDSLADVLGSRPAEMLATLGVHTVGELLRYTPRRYVRRGHVADQERPETGEWLTIVGRVTKSDLVQMRSRKGAFLKVKVTDDNDVYEASFFNPYKIKGQLRPGARVMMAGTVKYFRDQIQLSHPEWMILPDGAPEIDQIVGSKMLKEMYAIEEQVTREVGGSATGDGLIAMFDREILPMYPANKNVQTWDILGAVRQVLNQSAPIPDALTEAQRRDRGLISTDEAIRKIHLPDSDDDVKIASYRLKFDEAMAIQTVLAQRRLAGRSESAPPCPRVPGGLEDKLRERLPFTLTDGQLDVGEELAEDLARAQPMSRLLQGEVGSGKTLVSLLAMLRVVDNGYQCAILAPTEVLAAQHYRTMKTMLGDLAEAGELTAAEGATRIALLTGSMKTKGRRETLLDVVTGTAGIVIGTHALLEERVEFFDLGLVVIDEQHRFGVEQRDVLRGKGRDGRVPHFLVMTATPIPRTVAMTAFGDLETSVLRELPRGRQPISTSVVPVGLASWVERVWSRANEEIDAGRQVYVVCSRIGDGPEPEPDPDGDADKAPKTTSVLEQYEALVSGPFAHRRVEMLHGRLPADEKNAVMDEFGRGEIDVLVSTTVIEVGVDVPNATTMVIVDAERFGVSQLHQLRGRVGRGQHAGLCLLMTQSRDGSPSMQRLRAVAASNDGFELARVDLEQRREGDLLGSLQSGVNTSLRFLSLLDDIEVIEDARGLAEDVVSEDITLLEHRALADLVDGILVPQKIAYLDKS
ncbi:ATP-dependent DNA helicase RecG [Gordonia jinghuaiqii]|uniref:ATP-dependent DNA helicase RecG n=1 Tax=Gordonia jinghuaiqii TaxID=2758710 RepID=A0A7D7QFX6_9ACTN|nr:ATP-dependent DNA helicase RecG [Gordonia jinghuaiqii]MCR5977067.1 ATP-dependent DNA helicase RecG [Gordonia jinghuaiqii]QMT00322.1 ATP-dependent DNA helicase RecG [Gordonia jinghuaiqii]